MGWSIDGLWALVYPILRWVTVCFIDAGNREKSTVLRQLLPAVAPVIYEVVTFDLASVTSAHVRVDSARSPGAPIAEGTSLSEPDPDDAPDDGRGVRRLTASSTGVVTLFVGGAATQWSETIARLPVVLHDATSGRISAPTGVLWWGSDGVLDPGHYPAELRQATSRMVIARARSIVQALTRVGAVAIVCHSTGAALVCALCEGLSREERSRVSLLLIAPAVDAEGDSWVGLLNAAQAFQRVRVVSAPNDAVLRLAECAVARQAGRRCVLAGRLPSLPTGAEGARLERASGGCFRVHSWYQGTPEGRRYVAEFIRETIDHQ